MRKKNSWFLALWIVSFAVFLACSILFESPVCLYVASAMPILIVIWLPDREPNQYIRARHLKHVHLRTHDSGETGRLTISFNPGFIRWKQAGKLYFHLDSLSREETAEAAADQPPQASLSILPYDLTPHPSKPGWVGIDLDQVAARTTSLSITTDEVARFIIPLRDLEEIAVRHMAGLVSVARGGNQLHA
ncbi:hypothetical protein [Paenibacillus puerhi]|uniref:hypothetical protein n=1 Tax=Paenibacillus puerhi TaxID=2692622 RepID=UPI00135C149E|nr:hypothetical protein [Paenibacillus puerhi]